MKTTGTLQDFEVALQLGQPGAGPGTEPAYSPYGCGKNRVTEIYLNLPEVRTHASCNTRPHPTCGPFALQRFQISSLILPDVSNTLTGFVAPPPTMEGARGVARKVCSFGAEPDR